MLKFLKKNWLSVLTLTIAAAILIYTVMQPKYGGFSGFIENCREMNPFWVVVILFCILAYWLFDTLCLHILTIQKEKAYGFGTSFVVAMLGLLYSAITPFATGGQPLQIYRMNKTGVKTGIASSIITLRSLIFQTGMLVYAIVCCIFSWRLFNTQVKGFHWYLLLGIVCNLAFIFFIIFISISKRAIYHSAACIINQLAKLRLVKDKNAMRGNAFRQIRLFRRSMTAAKSNAKVTILCFAITFLQLTAFYTIPYCIYRAFNLSGFSALYMISANALIYMITAFVPLPGGSGAAEGSFYMFFKLFFPEASIMSATLIWRLATYYLCILVGMIISVASSPVKKFSRLRQFLG